MIRPTSKVKDNSEDDEGNDGQDFDGSGDAMRLSIGVTSSVEVND